MHPILLILPIALPVVFWAAYHYHKDRHLPEPPALLVVTFALGMAAAWISKLIYTGLDPLGLRYDAVELAATNTAGLAAYTLLAIGPIEEFSKLLLFVVVVLRFRELDEPIDGIIYASFLRLGYAAVENWNYLEYLDRAEAYARGFAGPVVHIVFASIWGHWVAGARLAGRPLAGPVLGGFAVAALLHGLYDFLVFAAPPRSLPVAAAIIAAIWVWRLRLIGTLAAAASQER